MGARRVANVWWGTCILIASAVPRGTSADVASTSTTLSAGQTSCPKTGPYKGTLCKPPEQLLPPAFFQMVDNVEFDSEDAVGETRRPLECDPAGPGCPANTGRFPRKSVLLSIRPAVDAHLIDPDQVTANGTIVARIVHENNKTWRRAKLDVSPTAGVYWYVVLIDDGQANSAADVLYVRSSRNPRRLEVVNRNEKFRACGEHASSSYAEARFGRCEIPATISPRVPGTQARLNIDAPRGSAQRAMLFAPLMPDDGLWLRCAEGCCSTTEP